MTTEGESTINTDRIVAIKRIAKTTSKENEECETCGHSFGPRFEIEQDLIEIFMEAGSVFDAKGRNQQPVLDWFDNLSNEESKQWLSIETGSDDGFSPKGLSSIKIDAIEAMQAVECDCGSEHHKDEHSIFVRGDHIFTTYGKKPVLEV